MGVAVAASGAFLAVAWLVTVAIPSGWHVVADEGLALKNYYVGLYQYEVAKGTAGKVLALGAQLAESTGMVEKESVDKLESHMEIGKYWIWEAKTKNCDLLSELGLPHFKEHCNMWTRLQTMSIATASCIAIGSLLVLISAGMTSGTKPSKGARKAYSAAGMLGPVIGLCGLGMYYFCTKDFPVPAVEALQIPGGTTPSFGGVFWAALVIGVLAGLWSAVSASASGGVDEDKIDFGEAEPFASNMKQHDAMGHPQCSPQPPAGPSGWPAAIPGAMQAPGSGAMQPPGSGAMQPPGSGAMQPPSAYQTFPGNAPGWPSAMNAVPPCPFGMGQAPTPQQASPSPGNLQVQSPGAFQGFPAQQPFANPQTLQSPAPPSPRNLHGPASAQPAFAASSSPAPPPPAPPVGWGFMPFSGAPSPPASSSGGAGASAQPAFAASSTPAPLPPASPVGWGFMPVSGAPSPPASSSGSAGTGLLKSAPSFRPH